MENIDVQINLLNQSIGWLETYHGNNISEINRLKNFSCSVWRKSSRKILLDG